MLLQLPLCVCPSPLPTINNYVNNTYLFIHIHFAATLSDQFTLCTPPSPSPAPPLLWNHISFGKKIDILHLILLPALTLPQRNLCTADLRLRISRANRRPVPHGAPLSCPRWRTLLSSSLLIQSSSLAFSHPEKSRPSCVLGRPSLVVPLS